MDKTKRQKRIVQKKRNLNKWIKREVDKRILWDAVGTSSFSDEEVARRASINANHGKRCSCSGCGNPRRHGRKPVTMQEKKKNSGWLDWFDGF